MLAKENINAAITIRPFREGCIHHWWKPRPGLGDGEGLCPEWGGRRHRQPQDRGLGWPGTRIKCKSGLVVSQPKFGKHILRVLTNTRRRSNLACGSTGEAYRRLGFPITTFCRVLPALEEFHRLEVRIILKI